MINFIQASAVQHCPFENTQRQQNVDFILSTMSHEAGKGANLVVFPEAGITNFVTHGQNGFLNLLNDASIEIESPEIEAIRDQAKQLNIYVVVGFNERSKTLGIIYNSAALIGPNGIVGVSRKQNFPGIEKLYYTPGPRLETFSCELGKIGIIICYDALFPEIVRHHFRNGAEILVFSSSFWMGGAKGGAGDPKTKRNLWQNLPFVTAVQNQAFVVSANGSGKFNAGLGYGTWERMGLSQIVSPSAGILAQADVTGTEVLRAPLAKKDLIEARTNYRFLSETQTNLSSQIDENKNHITKLIR